MAVTYAGKISAQNSAGVTSFSINPGSQGMLVGDVLVLVTVATGGVAAPTCTGLASLGDTYTNNSARSDILAGVYAGGTLTLDYGGNGNGKSYFFTAWRGAEVPTLARDITSNTETTPNTITWPQSATFVAPGFALFSLIQYNSSTVYGDGPATGGPVAGLSAVGSGSHGQAASYRQAQVATGAQDPGGTYAGSINGLHYRAYSIAIHEARSGNPVVMVI